MKGLTCPPALGVNGPGRIWRRPAVERWRGRYLPHVVAAALYVGVLLAAAFKELQELGRNFFAGVDAKCGQHHEYERLQGPLMPQARTITRRAPCTDMRPETPARTAHSAIAQTRARERHSPDTSAGRDQRMPEPDLSSSIVDFQTCNQRSTTLQYVAWFSV